MPTVPAISMALPDRDCKVELKLSDFKMLNMDIMYLVHVFFGGVLAAGQGNRFFRLTKSVSNQVRFLARMSER